MIHHENLRTWILLTIITTLFLLMTIDTYASQTAQVLTLRLKTQPFSSMMCKKIRPDENIRIRIANHRDIILRKVPNQHMPQQFEEVRKKSYVHHLTFHDLTNGEIVQGGIAFDTKHAVIFTDEHPQGISREEFVAMMPGSLIPIAHKALNTFLRLHPILNAAIDGCRPYPSQVTYGTDDEFDKISTGRITYGVLSKQFNVHSNPNRALIRHKSGTSGGFYDPRLEGKRVSYHTMNPLSFYKVSTLSGYTVEGEKKPFDSPSIAKKGAEPFAPWKTKDYVHHNILKNEVIRIK